MDEAGGAIAKIESLVGTDDPDIIEAKTLFPEKNELLQSGELKEAVKSFKEPLKIRRLTAEQT